MPVTALRLQGPRLAWGKGQPFSKDTLPQSQPANHRTEPGWLGPGVGLHVPRPRGSLPRESGLWSEEGLLG